MRRSAHSGPARLSSHSPAARTLGDMSDDIEGQTAGEGAGVSDVSDDTEGQVEAGRWMTIPEAAFHFRKSTKTIERWANAGRLQRHPTARPVEVWVSGAPGESGASDMSDDTVGPEERTVALAERMSDAVGRQLSPILAALERTEERVRTLERENGTLAERVAGLERELGAVREMSDADRQRLSDELDAARAALDDLKAGQLAGQAEAIGRLTAELETERTARSTLEARTAPQAGDAPRGARDQPLADTGAVGARGAGNLHRGSAAGVAALRVTGRRDRSTG
jgi:hypothetical protein